MELPKTPTRDSLAAAIAHVEAYVREHLPEGFTLTAEFRSNGVELKVQDDEFLCDELEAEEPGGVMELCQAANDEIAKEFPDDEDDEDSGISPDWDDTEDD